MTRAELLVARRFNGPPASGNGGYAAGALAALLLGSGLGGGNGIRVRLRRPPPLDVALAVSDGAARLPDGEVVLEAVVAEDSLEYVEAVPLHEAEAARSSYAGLRAHPFPTCFSCGPERVEGDGLRIFPGRVDGGRVASSWVPDALLLDDGRIPEAVTWAALDCVGGWSSDIEQRPMVLGQITARVDLPPRVGEPHVVVGESVRREGRRTFTRSTLYDADGRALALAAHVWVEVDPAAFSGPSA